MPVAHRLVVFNALITRPLLVNDEEIFRDELAAFRVAFRARRFKILVTEGIISEYQADAGALFAIQLQPTLNNHLRRGRAIYTDETMLPRLPVSLAGLPREHRVFVLDAIAGDAEYLVTDRRRWLNLSAQTEPTYGLKIVTPARFVELEG